VSRITCNICGMTANVMGDGVPTIYDHYLAEHYRPATWADHDLTHVKTPTPASSTISDDRAILSGKRRSTPQQRAAARLNQERP
jgi:hypothetical protein